MNFSCVYVEEAIRHSARVEEILSRTGDAAVVTIERYGEVFNRRSQNFRLQKSRPALILARKHGRLVLPAPPGYGFEAGGSYYFSHMFNCVYDCRYCFLQGMYRSANYVLFTNYEEFADQIDAVGGKHSGPVFYSGYDCDSLALEPVSRFVDFFLDWFSMRPAMTLEIRTKSTQVRDLLKKHPIANCIVAMSFTPHATYSRWEQRVPAIDKRIEALARLQEQGWSIALRFEPLIYSTNFKADYEQLFAELFGRLDADKLHSVSVGQFRMPKKYFTDIAALYPDEALFAREYDQHNGQIVQLAWQQQQMQAGIEQLLFRYIEKKQYYRCA